MTEEKYKSFLLRFGFWAAIAIPVYLAFRYLLNPLMPFIIAFLVAGLLQPVIDLVSKRPNIKRKTAAVVLAILAYVLLAGLIVLLIVGIVSLVVGWASGLPALFSDTITPWVIQQGDKLSAILVRINPDMDVSADNLLSNAISSLSGTVMDFSMSAVAWASSVGAKLPGAMLTAVICVIATLFVSSDFEKITGAVRGVMPDRVNEMAATVKHATKLILGKYAKSYLLILLITFTEICVGLLIIGFDNAPAIAAVIALFDILPIVGSGMVLLPWTIVVFIQGKIGRGIGLAILYIFVVVIREIIEPKIVGKQVGLHPLVTLICMWVGLKLLGGVGMFAFPITLLIIKDLEENKVINIGFLHKKTAPEDGTETPSPDKTQEEPDEILL